MPSEILSGKGQTVQTETEITYELWDDELNLLPPHSRLYHLKPIGMGSPFVESLTSYVTRLAEAHSILSRTLVTDEILPRLNESHLYHNDHPTYDHLTKFWKQSAFLNGTSIQARDWVQAMEQLTLRRDLRFLTMLTWSSVLSSRGLLRRTQAWCPACYQEWRESKQVIYQPLLWQLSVIAACPRHCLQLHLCCPYVDCGQAFSPLTPRSQIGYCPQCGRWLGNVLSSTGDKQTLSEEEHERQRWVSTAVGELLAAAPRFPEPPRQEVIARTITAHVNGVMKGNFSVFARRLTVHRRTVWEWGQGTQIPQLDTLLHLCAYFGTSPVLFFKERAPEATPTHMQEPEGKQPVQKPKKRFRRFETERLRCALEAALQDEVEPPPSMREVARRLQYDSSHLYKHFPDLCRAIATRYRAYQQKQRHIRLEQICKRVQQTVQALHEQGDIPSERKVGKRLKSRGVLKENEVRTVLYKARREQGWQR
jgi:transcriptional regulator with XRE-family HTH domain